MKAPDAFADDPDRLRVILGESGLSVERLEIDFLRRDTGRRALIGIRFESRGQEGRGYLKLYDDEARSREVMEKWQSLRIRDDEHGEGVRLLAGAPGLLCLFPNDAGLRALPQVVDIDKLKRLLGETETFAGLRIRGRHSRIQVSRYKPEHRLVAFVEAATRNETTGETAQHALVLRLFGDARGRRLAGLARDLGAAGLSDLIPKQHGTLLDGRLHVEERLAGHELLNGRPVTADEVLELLRRFAAAEPSDLPFRSVFRTIQDRLTEARSYVPESFGPLLDEIEEELRRAAPFHGKRGLVHGDLHARQFIVMEDRLALIDLERCALSYPALDLGHLVTELELVGIERPEITAAGTALAGEIEEALRSDLEGDELRLFDLGKTLSRVSAAARLARRHGDGRLAEIETCLRRAGANARELAGDRELAEPIRIHPRRGDAWPAQAETSHGSIGGLYLPESGRFWALDPSDDEALPGLARALRSTTLVSWRPHQRAVLRHPDGDRYEKWLGPKRAAAAIATMSSILADERAVRILPRLLDHDAAQGRLTIEAVSGPALHEQLDRGDETGLAEAGAALAAFHELRPVVPLESAGDDDVDAFCEHASRLQPELATALRRAREQVPAARRGVDEVTMHGDMHEKNLIIGPDGPRIIDFEGARRGPAARDLGNILAHLELRRWQRGEAEETLRRRRELVLEGYARIRELPSDGLADETRRSWYRLIGVHLCRPRWESLARTMLERFHLALLVFLVATSLGACVAILPERADLEVEANEFETRMSAAAIKKGRTIEARGQFRDGVFVAERLEIEEDDDELEVKSLIEAIEGDRVRVGSVDFVIDEQSIFTDEDGNPLAAGARSGLVGAFAKAEGIEREGTLRLRKLALRQRKPGETDEVQGRVSTTDARRRSIEVGPVEIDRPAQAPVYWDVEGEPAPVDEEQDYSLLGDPRMRRIVRIDDDDERNSSGSRLTDWLRVGGELQWDLEWRNNHNLRDERKRDRILHTASAKLELAFTLDEKILIFNQFRASRDFEILDETDRLDFDFDLSLEQAFLVALDLPFEGMAIEVGRQKFDHGREWVMDDDLDGARIFLNFDDLMLEFSVSHQFLDPDREEDGITNFIGAAHLDLIEDTEILLYGIHRVGGELVDLDRWHVGFSLETEIDDFRFFLDAGYVTGREDDLEVEGFGVDAMALYTFEEHAWEPSIYLGFAYGSGDDDVSDGKDSSFRQTGLHDNNDKLNGVTSFRYLGELVRPELSNMMIWTVGVGFRPYRETSVDLVFHHYRQVEAANRLRDTRLRFDPLGLSPQLGSEIDLIIGLEAWDPFEFEIVVGWFRPGQAFEHGANEAWFFTFQAEFNF